MYSQLLGSLAMRRVLVVVATFVALNTGGFLTYRALQPESAAAPAPAAPAASDETFSRPAATIQPKSTPTPSTRSPEPEQIYPEKSIVSPPTNSPEEEPETEPAHEQERTKQVKRAPTRRVNREPAAAAPKTKAPESQPAEQPKSGIQKSVLEMDDNPYKRGE